ncbi:hypothetical protein [Chryseobacterium sp. OV279]|uniref:hypothetical protein n=1 Tax=Chryseobacterium sp. OV279 TaxID=1500285 RepID=UPI0009243727|nr:hypothetical protein [Chryseobacterium sp. OV279]SHF82021.1 hypothetical protein SAMN02787100_2684 [Chryseobacterium sp. OV279]
MRKFILTIIFIFLIIKIEGQAITSQNQIAQEYFSTSPNAASLGTYGLIPINLSTGSPNIDINLLRFLTKRKENVISLTYNLNSVKPEIPVQWTGLGWNLNVGGAVTREVNGNIDEAKGPVPNNGFNKNNYDYYSTYDNDNWHQLIDNNNDAPDTFLFQVNGISGKFYKNHKGKWIVSANEDVSLSITDEIKNNYFTYVYNGYTYPDKDRCIYGFEIKDKYGNVYIFGKNENALEVFDSSLNDSNSFSELDPKLITSKFVKSWYLTKIKYADGATINYEYEPDSNTTLIQHFNVNYGFSRCEGISPNCKPNTSYERVKLTYLKRITFDEGSIEFNRSLANTLKYVMSNSYGNYLNNYNNTLHWFKLNSIVMLDKSNTIVDKVEFAYIENNNERLKLNSIKIGKDPLAQKKYTFTYNPLTIPALVFNKTNVDHWGFFNNKNADILSIYSGSSSMNNYYNQREPDSIAVRAETLERIDYPTGGHSLMEYESNLYSKYVKSENNQQSIVDNNIDKLAGGLRVRRIKTYDSNNSSPTIKRYYYVRDYFNNQNISSGVLSGIPNYIQNDNFDLIAGYTITNLTSSAYIPLSETKGYHIGYSKVFEKNENGSITEYSYSNYDNGYNDLTPNYPSKKYNSTTNYSHNGSYMSSNWFSTNINTMRNSLSSERGLLLSKINYDNNHNLLSETSIQYNQNPNRLTEGIRNFKLDYLYAMVGPPPVMNAGSVALVYKKFTPYVIYSNAVQKIGEKTTDYQNGAPVLSQIEYYYNNSTNYQLSKQKTTSPDGITNEINYSYAHEKGNQLMVDRNMIGIPLESILVQTNNGITKTLSKTQTIYPTVLPTSQTGNLVLPLSIKSYDLQNIALPSTDVTYDKYDYNGNLQQYTTKEGIPVAIIWGYNYTQPIAKVQGATYDQISSLVSTIVTASENDASNSANEPDLITALSNFRNNSTLSNYQVTTYTYDPLIGVTSITPPSGIREIYIYDTANRLKEIREDNKNGKILKEYKYNYKN